MSKLIEWLSVPMERPQSYSPFHLIFTFVGLTVAIVLAFLLRKLNNKQNKIFLGVIGALLLISEVIKIIFTSEVLNGGNFAYWVFPFQLCSIPMYLLLIIPFVKNEKFNAYLYEFLFSITLATAFITFAEPSGLHKDYVFLTLHSYLWHLILVFIGFYVFFSKRACKNKYGFLKGMATFGVVTVIAFILNLCIRQPRMNAFYISPYVPHEIVVFDTIWETAGWLVADIVYLVAILLMCSAVYYISYGFRCMRAKKLAKVTESTQNAQEESVQNINKETKPQNVEEKIDEAKTE